MTMVTTGGSWFATAVGTSVAMGKAMGMGAVGDGMGPDPNHTIHGGSGREPPSYTLGPGIRAMTLTTSPGGNALGAGSAVGPLMLMPRPTGDIVNDLLIELQIPSLGNFMLNLQEIAKQMQLTWPLERDIATTVREVAQMLSIEVQQQAPPSRPEYERGVSELLSTLEQHAKRQKVAAGSAPRDLNVLADAHEAVARNLRSQAQDQRSVAGRDQGNVMLTGGLKLHDDYDEYHQDPERQQHALEAVQQNLTGSSPADLGSSSRGSVIYHCIKV